MRKPKKPSYEQIIAAKKKRIARIGIGLMVLAALVLGGLVFFGCAPKPRPEPSPAPAQVDAAPVITIPTAVIYEEVSVAFDVNSTKPLTEPALFARAYDKISIEGYADARGTDAYNTELSLRRAEAVATTLKIIDVTGEVSVVAYGKSKLLCYDMTEICHARNRRVVVKTTKGGHARP